MNFNQSKEADSKKHYFSALTEAAAHVKNSAVAIAQDQFEVFNHWFILPVRELVLLKDFEEDASYISKKMKSKISKKEAQQALDVLMRLGLLVRDEATKKLKQSNPVIKYDANVINAAVREFHMQTLERTKLAMVEDEFESWDLRSLSLAVPESEIKNVHKALREFIHELNMKFSVDSENIKAPPATAEAVIQLNAQVIQLTK